MANLAENRRATFDYEILETFEAGIVLLGTEVKSVRDGRMQITGSYAVIRGGEVWLLNAQIPAYQPKNAPDGYDPEHTRKLLLTNAEIKELTGRLEQKSYALVPLSVYTKKGLIKIKLGLGHARKKGDKREVIKKRDTDRAIRKDIA